MLGKLLIAGGALSKSKSEIFNEFIELSGGFKKAKILIIPTASEIPIETSDYTKNQFIKLGVKKDNIMILKVSEYCNEKNWVSHCNEIKDIEKYNHITGAWFLGGDQSRIAKAMYNNNLSDTEILKLLRNKYCEGIVIGGSSAGAAIMSERMIASGTKDGALKYPLVIDEKVFNMLDKETRDKVLYIKKGIGFFKYGIIDQHFSQRNRLERLIKTVDFDEKYNIGIGIDEDTAIVFDEKTKEARVLGSGKVTLYKKKAKDEAILVYYKSAIINLRGEK